MAQGSFLANGESETRQRAPTETTPTSKGLERAEFVGKREVISFGSAQSGLQLGICGCSQSNLPVS